MRSKLKVIFSHARANPLQLILAIGILLRIVVFIFLRPMNNDPHFEFVEYIAQQAKLPASDEFLMAFHPPLYYLLATPLAMLGSQKLVQALSLLFAVATFYLLYHLLKTTDILKTNLAKCHVLLLSALLPQFVMFSLFISNDSLTFLVGTLSFVFAFRYIDCPNNINLVLLAAVVGAGLLTKGSFLAFGPPLAALVVVMGIRQKKTIVQHLVALALFGTTSLGIGSYKYIENTINFGRPIPGAEGFDPQWAAVMQRQQQSFQGVKSVIDVNIWKLVQEPFLSDHTRHSIPLMMYGTFWYPYIPESNFVTTRHYPFLLLPRVIYLVGLLPSMLIVLGGVICLRRNSSPIETFKCSEAQFGLRVKESVVLALLLFNLILVVVWGIKNGGAWSFFQARLLFPAFFSIVILFGTGWEATDGWPAGIRRWVNALLYLLYLLFGAYFATEMAGRCYQFVADRMSSI